MNTYNSSSNQVSCITVPVKSVKSVKSKRPVLVVKGFTIIELMVTIAIVGILSIIALPDLSDFLVRMRVDNQLSEVQRLLLTARNNAISTGLNTTVCPLDENKNCSNDWEGEISVFANTSATTNTLDGTDTLLKVKASTNGSDTLKLSIPGSIVYTPSGRALNNTANTLTFCPKWYPNLANGITISTSGRSYIGTENSDNKYVDRANNIFTCS